MKDKKCLLKVYAEYEDGKVFIDWEFPDKCKVFALVGIMETIKQDLIDYNIENGLENET